MQVFVYLEETAQVIAIVCHFHFYVNIGANITPLALQSAQAWSINMRTSMNEVFN